MYFHRCKLPGTAADGLFYLFVINVITAFELRLLLAFPIGLITIVLRIAELLGSLTGPEEKRTNLIDQVQDDPNNYKKLEHLAVFRI
jgi:hypothetical protein